MRNLFNRAGKSPAPALPAASDGPGVLQKDSNETQIKAYFCKILELSQASEAFPVNLDDVYPLVYSAKGKAVRALKVNFIENVDFITIAQNGNGGKFAEITYKLSIPCLEWFIARKVRPVFEVYRTVFHQVAGPAKALTQDATPVTREQLQYNTQFLGAAIENAIRVIDYQAQTLGSLERKVKELEAKVFAPDAISPAPVPVQAIKRPRASLTVISRKEREAAGCHKLGLSYTEIAEIQGVTPDTVRQRIARYNKKSNIDK